MSWQNRKREEQKKAKKKRLEESKNQRAELLRKEETEQQNLWRQSDERREDSRTQLLISQARSAKIMLLLTAAAAAVALWQAKITADSVKATAEFARRTFEFSQRAVLTYEYWTLKTPIEVGQLPMFEVNLKNFGQTGAKLLHTYAAVGVVAELPESPPNGGTVLEEGGVVLEAQQSLTRPFERKTALTADEVAAIRIGAKRLFAVGAVRFEDVFGQLHDTRFCVHFDIKTNRVNQCSKAGYHGTTPAIENQVTQEE